MSEENITDASEFHRQYQIDDGQKCFIGHSFEARWHDDFVQACNSVLVEFGLDPWYATDHFDPTKPLLEKVVDLIAHTGYGIYDLSHWRKDDNSEWVMPRNVLIELGIAIALNRPTLLLRHAENRISGLKVPACLEGISTFISEFTGSVSLKKVLRERLSQWTSISPEQDWWNRYCSFGNRICEYREAYPRVRQLDQEILQCHISDGKDIDHQDFRGVVEEVLERFNNVTFSYLDSLPITEGYNFLLCTFCQTVRSTPFAIYRITPQTFAETYIAIGMSIALEAQFTHKIPKILLTANVQDVPSLLSGYEVVIARNDQELMTHLRKFLPMVIQKVRKTLWKPRPLPFIELIPKNVEIPIIEDEQDSQQDIIGEDLSSEDGASEQQREEVSPSDDDAPLVIPDILPVLPLKDTVIYPFAVQPLGVGQERSIRLIDDVMRGDRLVVLVAQKSAGIEQAGPVDIFKIGTISRITRMTRMPDSTVQIIVQGLERVDIGEFTQEKPYLAAHVTLKPDMQEQDDETEAIKRNVVSYFQRLVALVQTVPQEVAAAALNLEEARQVVYVIATFLQMDLELHQKLLELDSVRAKLQNLNTYLTHELEILELGKKIQVSAQEEMSKAQREYLLREQIKAIQRELGEETEE